MLNILKNPFFKMCRVDHWFKNIFVIPGIILAIFFTKKNILFPEFIYIFFNFLSICLIASSNYLINEYLDARFDKFHPIKKNRPSVKKKIKLFNVLALYVSLILLSLVISFKANLNFIILLLIFAILGILYNVRPFRFKDRSYLDIIFESLNNPVRLLLGWSIIEESLLPPSSIFLCFWMGGAFLMTIKRFAEFRSIKKKNLIKYRISFLNYSENLLLIKSFFYALMACFFLAIFLIKYRIEYLVLFPFISFLFAYYLHLGLKKHSITQTPEKLFNDKILTIIVFLIIFIFALTTFIDIKFLNILTEPIKFEIF